MIRLFFLSGLLAGCATMAVEYPRIHPFVGTWTIRGDYSVGEEISAATGMAMVVSGEGREVPLYRASTSFRPPEIPMKVLVGSEYFDTVDSPIEMIDTETDWIPLGSVGDGDLLLWSPRAHDYGIVVSPDGTSVKGWYRCESMLLTMNCNPVEPSRATSQNAWPSNAFLITQDGVFMDDDNAYRAELVYTGRSGDAIGVVYREYYGDMARPAFILDLAYDLSKSGTIAFRGLVLRVLEATNMGIRFVVEEDKGWATRLHQRSLR